MSKDGIGNEFSHIVEIDRVGPQGLPVRLEADASALKALARQMKILAVLSLKAELRVAPDPALNGHFRVTGRLDAEVEQSCIASLEPVRQRVSEAFDRLFAPAGSLKAVDLAEDEAEWLDPDAEDPADPIEDGRIDVGAVVAEELALGLDPYPRKPEAGLPEGYKPDAEDGAKVSPFAALAKLKKD